MRRRAGETAPDRRALIRAERCYEETTGGSREISVGLAYPNRYAIGMANLGYQTIRSRIMAAGPYEVDRLFLNDAVAGDGRKVLRSFDSDRPMGGFDVIAFSVSFENDFVNIVRMLKDAGIPPRAADRNDRHPIVVVGGAITFLNVEPIRVFVDVILAGEGEEIALEYLELFRMDRGKSRRVHLENVATLQGAYVPSIHTDKPAFERRSYPAMGHDPALTRILTPHSEFRDTLLLEISRGCPRRCRFCTVGSAFPKFRMLPADRAVEIAERFRDEDKRLGREPLRKIGLVTAAFFDHTGAEELAGALYERGFEIGASSVRVDQLTDGVLGYLRGSGLQTLTIAPEAGTERLRGLIRKEASDEKIMEGVDKVARAGFRSLRIYYMIGLPYETDADRTGLIREATRIRSYFLSRIKGHGRVTVSLHPFVPKPRTAFQWSPMLRPTEAKSIVMGIKKSLAGIRVKSPSMKQVYIEGILARGGHELAPFLESLADGAPWRRAAREAELDLNTLIHSQHDPETPMPWEGNVKDRVDQVNLREFRRAEAACSPAGREVA